MSDVPVVVVGGGLSGCSAAYHLAQKGVGVLLLEAGRIGAGCDKYLGGSAGPSVFPYGKMVLGWPELGLACLEQAFGRIYLKKYLSLLEKGRDLQKDIALSLDVSFVENGSLLTADNHRDWQELNIDISVFRSVNGVYQFLGPSNCEQRYGVSFSGGYFIEKDFLIDERAYLHRMCEFFDYVEGCVLLDFDDDGSEVIVHSSHGDIVCDHLVLALNGFSDIPNIRPYWTHAVCFECEGPDLPCCFTYSDYYFDFTRRDNILQVGGIEQKVLDVPLALTAITDWAKHWFDFDDVLEHHYGVVGCTADGLPLCGSFSSNSNVLVLAGCNAVGQSSLSFAASLVPGLLGYSPEVDRVLSYLVHPLRKTLFP